jgi:hypothetical protein
MNTTRTDAPQISRRDILRGAFASAALLALPACMRDNGGPCIVSANNGREIPLFLGNNALSQDSITNMRNDVNTLKGVLGGLVELEGSIITRPARSVDFSGARSVARTCLGLADNFMGESENPAPERMDYLTKRWEFVHAQLVNSIRFYREGLYGMGIGTRSVGQELGVEMGGI